MISEQARVVAVDGQTLWVETHQVSACHACKAKSACGQSVLNKLSDGKRQQIAIDISHSNEIFAVDDQVEIGIPESSLMQGITWAYLVPLIGLFGGAYCSISLFPDAHRDLVAIAGAAIGFAASLLLVRGFLRSDRACEQLQPKLLGRSF